MAPLGFASRPALVRHTAEHDPAALDAALVHGGRLALLLAGDKSILRAGPPPGALLNGSDFQMPTDHLEQVLLGHYLDVPVIATLLKAEHAPAFEADPAFIVGDLRAIATDMLVPEHELGLLAAAKSLLSWHNRHRFCANCGHATTLALAGFRRDCPSCNAQHFPRTDSVAIMLVTRGEKCLLGRSPHFPPGRFSCLAGFIEPGETIETAVRRETFEETGIRVGAVSYLQSQPWPFPSNLMIGMHGEAESEDITIDPTEIEAARWFTRDEVRQMFAGTHPEGFTAPAPVAIAYHLMQKFAEG